MLLFRSWKDSLALFVPKNMKLFLLVTIKSAVETYMLLGYYFWWLILCMIALEMGCSYPACIGIWRLIEIVAYLVCAYVLFILVRPSLALKDSAYIYQQCYKSGIGFVCMYVFFDVIRFAIRIIGMQFFSVLPHLALYNLLYDLFVFIYYDAPLIILPIFICAVLFFMDSTGSIKEWFLSIWRGIIMVIFNLPFCILSIALLYIIWKVLILMFSVYSHYLLFSFIPFVLSYFKNMYVKRLHDQFDLYFTV